jgi:hypothetical protein
LINKPKGIRLPSLLDKQVKIILDSEAERDITINQLSCKSKRTPYSIVKIENQVRGKVLYDTGANTNCIDAVYLRNLKLNIQVKGTKTQLRAANKSSMETEGTCTIRVSFDIEDNNDQGEMIEFCVVKNLSVPIIIGWQTIQKLKMIIDTTKEMLILKEKNIEIKLLKEEEKERELIYTIEDHTLSPHSVSKISTTNISKKEGPLQIKNNIAYPLIEVLDGIIEKTTHFILVSNTSDENICIKKDSPVAYISEKNIEIRTMMEEDKEVIEKEERSDLKEARKQLNQGNLTNNEQNKLWILLKK